MKIIILNGNPKSDNTNFDEYLNKLSSLLKNQGNETTIYNLREMEINTCIGCYTCWLKTPGICIYKDNMPEILSQMLNSDFVLYTSPVIMGFVRTLLKRVMERLLPFSLPFIYVEKDKMQHVSRYERYPVYSLLLGKSANYDEVNSEIIEKVFRSAKTQKFLFIKTMDMNPEEAVNEINSI